ncbi:unnamed protein product, partial [Closterium sp. Naga37s-1]
MPTSYADSGEAKRRSGKAAPDATKWAAATRSFSRPPAGRWGLANGSRTPIRSRGSMRDLMDAAMSPVAGTPEAASPRAGDGSAAALASLAKPSSSGDLSSLGDANSDIPWWSVALPLESSGGAASPLFSPLLSPLPGNSGLGGDGFALYGDLGRLDGEWDGEWDSPEGRRQSDESVAAAADDDAGDAAVADVTQGARGDGVGGVGAAALKGWGDDALSSRGTDAHVAAASAASAISGASGAGSGISGGGVARSSSAWDGCGNDVSSSRLMAGRGSGVGADMPSQASGGEGSAGGRAEEHAEAACPRGPAAGQAGLAETRQVEGSTVEQPGSEKPGSEKPVLIEAVRVGRGTRGGEGEQVGSEASGEAGAAGLQRRYPSFRVRGHAPHGSGQDSERLAAPAVPALEAAAGPGGAAAQGGRQGAGRGQKERGQSSAGVLQLWSPGSSPSDASPSALAGSAAVAAAAEEAEAAVHAADSGSGSGDAMDSAGAWRPTAHVDGSPLPAGALSVAAAAEARPKRRHPKAPAAAAVAAAAGRASAASPRGAWRSAEARSSRRRRRAQQRQAGGRGASGSSGEWDDDFWGVGPIEGRVEGHTGADGVQGGVGGTPQGVVALCASSAAAAAAGAAVVHTGSDVVWGKGGRATVGVAVDAVSGMAECRGVEVRQGGSGEETARPLAADAAGAPPHKAQQPTPSAARTPSRFASLRQRWEHGGAAAGAGGGGSDGSAGDGSAGDGSAGDGSGGDGEGHVWRQQQGDDGGGGGGADGNGGGGGGVASGGGAGGTSAECVVHLIGTAHVSKESCNEVRRIIRQVKPEVVFLEVCSDRVAMLMPMDHMQVPSLQELITVWRSNKSNAFAVIYGYLLAKVAARMEVCPGAEFRAAYEEAVACGAVVKLGDRPVQVTLRRTWAMMSRWHRVKLVALLLLQALWLPSKAELDHLVEELKSSDLLSVAVAEMGRAFPSLLHTLIHERDLYMACMLRHVAKRSSRVVAVVGKGHVEGITAHWTCTDID